MNGKTTTYEELEATNFDRAGISNNRFTGVCSCCGEPYSYSAVKKWTHSRTQMPEQKSNWNRCAPCWARIRQYDNPDWLEKNSKAQLIAQNRPEQKRKNAEGVRKSWTPERKAYYRETMLRRWENSTDAEKTSMTSGLEWTKGRGDKFQDIMRRSIGVGGYKGVYNGIHFDSALEMSFLMWCEEEGIEVRRYDMMPIPYTAEDGKERNYYPDFIIGKDTIVEIKGTGLYYRKNFERNEKKIDALKEYCYNMGTEYRLIFEKDVSVRKHYRTARRICRENNKNIKISSQG